MFHKKFFDFWKIYSENKTLFIFLFCFQIKRLHLQRYSFDFKFESG